MYTKRFLEERAAKNKVPNDWCYIYNFENPNEPVAVSFPAGQGKVFKETMEDFVKDIFTCTSHDSVLLVSNGGKVYKLKCYELPEGNKNSKGMNVVNLLPLDPEEKIECMIAVGDFEADRYITSVTKMGMLKRTKLSAYSNVRKNGLAAVGLNEGDELATILLILLTLASRSSWMLLIATSPLLTVRLTCPSSCP